MIKKHYFIFIVLCIASSYNLIAQNEYQANYVTQQPVIDGIQDDLWKKARIDTLSYFYNAKKEDHKALSTFQMLWDEDNIYMFYTVKDKYINAATTHRDGATFLDDCAELFITPTTNNPSIYFCLETNVLEKTNDIVVIKALEEGGKNTPVILKGYNPDFDVSVKINGTLNNNSDIDSGWTLEMAIPLKAFSRFSEFNPIKAGAEWSFLAVKQDRDEDEVGFRTMATNFYMDEIEEKDVHQPEKFGVLRFVK